MCEARFFDSRVNWRMVPVADALLIVRCWRCGKLVPLAPIFSDGDLKRLIETTPSKGGSDGPTASDHPA
jgi:hypothetical protein